MITGAEEASATLYIPFMTGQLFTDCREVKEVTQWNLSHVRSLMESNLKPWDTIGNNYIEWLHAVCPEAEEDTGEGGEGDEDAD